MSIKPANLSSETTTYSFNDRGGAIFNTVCVTSHALVTAFEIKMSDYF
jgi:hypothetical protein